MFGSAQMFTDLSFNYSRVHNKSLDVEGDPNYISTRIGAGITVGKRFDPFRSAWVSYAYQSIGVSEYMPGRTLSSTGLDYYSTLAAGARHDTRNLREYATRGFYSAVTLAKKGFGVGGVDMFTVHADVRGYAEIFRGTAIALRGLTQMSGGPGIPSYEHAFLGYGERIRGHFSVPSEGDDLAAGFAELRIPVLSPRYLVIPQIPIRQFSTWRLGLYVTAFADFGVTWYKNERPAWENVLQGYGMGLNFLLPYSTVLRLERAWNEHGAGEWIIDLNAAF
jgi:outer membrane protein assembly factor BamA